MGSIITFYSYKGGVGRTMAVANIAVLLARRGLRVLVIDWDLEAPGLHRYFAGLKVMPNSVGLLDLFLHAANGLDSVPQWEPYTSTVAIDDSTKFTMLTAGGFDDEYEKRVLNFDWNRFFQHQNGGAILESFRQQWINTFDVTLIDSRTGISDSGGVCTVQMPDILVPVFVPNRQSLDGTKRVVLRAQRARQELAYDRTRLLVFPLISRFDSRTEYKESQAWLRVFADELKDFYRDWLPKSASPLQMLERTKVPYVAFFSFGEKLPVITEGTTDPESLGFAYQNATTLIANDFKNADRLILAPSTEAAVEDAPRSPLKTAEWLSRIDQSLTAVQFQGLPSFTLSATLTRGVDIPELSRSSESLFAELLENPPKLRASGFDLTVSSPSILGSHGKLRRTFQPKYKLLELWRDGCLIFIADGDRFLCHDIERKPTMPRKINTLALAESTLLFCDLAQKIYKEVSPHPRSVEYLIGFRNLSVDRKNPTLKPIEETQLSWPESKTYEAEYDSEHFAFTADPDEDPAVTAFQLVAEIYVWFGIEQNRVPYSMESNGRRLMDIAKLQNVSPWW